MMGKKKVDKRAPYQSYEVLRGYKDYMDARGWGGLSQLTDKTKLSRQTMHRLSTGKRVRSETMQRVATFLEAEGFLPLRTPESVKQDATAYAIKTGNNPFLTLSSFFRTIAEELDSDIYSPAEKIQRCGSALAEASQVIARISLHLDNQGREQ